MGSKAFKAEAIFHALAISKGASMFLIESFIDEASCLELQKKILAIPFMSGKASAGKMAGRVKNNLELDSKKGKEILDAISDKKMELEQYVKTSKLPEKDPASFRQAIEFYNQLF